MIKLIEKLLYKELDELYDESIFMIEKIMNNEQLEIYADDELASLEQQFFYVQGRIHENNLLRKIVERIFNKNEKID